MSPWLHTLLLCLLAILSFALLAATFRLLKGPTVTDRIMALDLISIDIVACIGLCTILFDASVLLDVAIVIALISFVGTVAFSLFVQRKAAS